MPVRGESVGTAYVHFIGDGEGLRDSIDDELDAADEDFEKAGKRHSKKYRKGFEDDNAGFMRRLSKRFDELADPIGRLLGRGSRNNFLNFFGSMVTNTLLATEKFVSFFGTVLSGFKTIGSAVATFFKTFFKRTDEAASVMTRFSTAVTAAFGEGGLLTLASGGTNIIAGVAAIGAALAVAALSAGALVSALLLLGGIITALAATISFALVGALAAIAPLLIPIAAGVAGIFAVVDKFKNATGDLKDSLDDVSKAAKGVKRAFNKEAFKGIGKEMEKVDDALKKFEPLAAAAGRGFRRFVGRVLNGLDSPALTKFLKVFERFLPEAMDDLGKIATNTLGGIGGLLRGSTGISQDFLNWLVKITDKFSEWANSKEGQESIKNFLEDAKESAKALGDFLSSAADALGSLLGPGKDSGDNIFTSMANSLDRVARWLDSHPEALKQFFQDSERFARQLGHAIEDIKSAIDTIDSPTTRKAAGVLVAFFSANIQAAALLIGFLDTVATGAAQMSSAVIGAFKPIPEYVAGVARGMAAVFLQGLKFIVTATLSTVDTILGAFARMPGPIGKGAKAAQAAFQDFANKATGNIDDLILNIKGIEVTANGINPVVDVNTTAATNKINTLKGLLNSLMAGAAAGAAGGAAAPPKSPVAVENGVSKTTVDKQSGSSSNSGRTVNVNQTVVSPSADPRAVAAEVVNHLVGAGY